MSPVVLQDTRVKENQASSSWGKLLVHSCGDEYTAATGWEDIAARGPVEYRGESVILDPACMYANVPYPFVLMGYPLIAAKRDDEAIYLFYLP